jgi:apolipoprotein N-acyltransferase
MFPGFDLNFLAWVALIPLLLLIKRSGALGAFLSSLAVGFIFYLALVWWCFKVDGGNAANVILPDLILAFYFGVFGLLAHYFNKKTPRWVALTCPTAWALLEYVRTHMGFLANPWGVLGYSQYAVLPVARISAFTGVYGVSFLIVTVNTVLAELIYPYLARPRERTSLKGAWLDGQKWPKGILTAVLLLSFASSLSALHSLKERGNPPSLKVALVQVNVAGEENTAANFRKWIFHKYSSLTLGAADSKPELIAWPSSSVVGRIPYDRILLKALSGLARKAEAFLLVGSTGQAKFNRQEEKAKRLGNSAFLFAPDGKIVGRYDKIRLLPFDEYLPLRDWLKWPSWIVSSDMTDTQAGEKLTVFRMKNMRFGVQICWENLFPDLFRKMVAQGVDFMVSMTNEGFTDSPSARYQMLAMNVFRAIENHVTIVRTAPTGVSSIIEPSGRISARIQDESSKDVDVEGYLLGQVVLSSKRTFYNRYGDWFIYGLFVVFGGFIVFSLVAKGSFTKTQLYRSRHHSVTK